MNPQDSFVHTTFTADSFLAQRRNVALRNTLPFQLQMLKDTGRYDAFDLKWQPIYGDEPVTWPVPKHLFWDSDVAKWIEALSYFGDVKSDEEAALINAMNELVGKIQAAQQDDGYLNIHFTVVDPKARFTNLRDLHELYNAGHLIECALAHQLRSGSDDLIKVMERYVALLVKTFGPGNSRKHGYPGHPEIELALVRFYKRTGSKGALELAKFFITERGNPSGEGGRHYYDVEAEERGESKQTIPCYYPAPRSYWYHQAHKPILEQETIEGHSVRATYLLTAVADLAVLDSGDFRASYIPALKRLWANMVKQKMYITGGIGAISQWEGFGIDYFLPQSTDEGGCYSETCAAIGVMMLAERLLQLELDREYADVLERSLYNAMLTGMSVDGKAFTYVNQMATCDADRSNKRESWFECSCCPPNVARVLGHIGGYLWTAMTTSSTSATVNVHLYASARLEYSLEGSTSKFSVTQDTKYPWDGEMSFTIEGDLANIDLTMNLRIPAWAEHELRLSPAPPTTDLQKGYLNLPPSFLRAHPKFVLSLPMKPRLIRPHPYTNQHTAVLARGPLIYCVEDVDNAWVTDHFKSVVWRPEITKGDADLSSLCEERWSSDLPLGNGYVGIKIKAAAWRLSTLRASQGALESPGLKQMLDRDAEEVDLVFVPYWARANRGGEGVMRVGIRTLD